MPIEKLDEFAKNGQKSTEGIILENGFPQEEKPARQWFNYIFNAISIKTNELIDFSQTNADAISGINTEIEDLNLARFDTGISVTSTYPEQVIITQSEKNSEYLSFEQFGAVGDGLTDDTVAIEKALNSGAALLSSKKDYVFSGDLDLLYSSGVIGSGNIIYNGYTYPIVKKIKTNHMWQGTFSAWQMGHADSVSTVQRRQIPAGVTHARNNFTSGTTILHSKGSYVGDSMRISRNATSTSSEKHNFVINLTPEEASSLVGKNCCLTYFCDKGEEYSGSQITVKVQYSEELFQPIIRQDGQYTSGNIQLISVTHVPNKRDKNAPYFETFFLPEDAQQVSISVDIPFSGVAGYEDWVEFESMAICISDEFCFPEESDYLAIQNKAETRYQTSYQSGVHRGAPVEQGTLQAVAINTLSNYAMTIPVRFNPPMATTPWFTFQSPTSSTEFRLLKKTSLADVGTNVSGQAYGLNNKGVTITNSATLAVGDRLFCHWTAESLI